MPSRHGGAATPLKYSYYETDIRQTWSRSTWTDAQWTMNRFAYPARQRQDRSKPLAAAYWQSEPRRTQGLIGRPGHFCRRQLDPRNLR